jgi:hypothetical protein
MKRHLLPTLPGASRVLEMLPSFGGGDSTVEKLEKPRLSLLSRDGRGAADRLTLNEVRGHLTFTANTVTAWYTAAPSVWPFRADARREALLTSIAGQYAMLAGGQLHIRRTSVPFDVTGWARALESNSRPLPDDPSIFYPPMPSGPTQLGRLEIGRAWIPPTWDTHMNNAIGRLADGDFAAGRTHIGVIFPRPSRLMRAARNGDDLDEAMIQQIDGLTEGLAAPGLFARPSNPDELAWLLYRSVGLGLAPPTFRAGNIGPDDIGEFADAVDVLRGPYSSTTQLTNRHTGETTHVAVLTVGRMEAQEVPQVHQPWAHLSEQAPYPVEYSARVAILGPDASRGHLERRLRMIISQQGDYADHGIPAPLELGRLAERAAVVGDEIDTGLPIDSSRAHGWHRLAVYGSTAKECLERARDLTRTYDQEAHIVLAHPKAQYQLLREFIPGEPVCDTGYIRRMPVKMLAAAMPQATASVGDNRGDLIGHTATSGTRPVFFDVNFPMEIRERSGLAVFVAEPGGGKSTLMGALGYLAARRGVQVTLMDPSGPLARLCQMPELRPYSRVIDLVGSEPGTLAPYALIPTPRRGEFQAGPTGDREFETAHGLAEAERSALALDIAQMLMPAQVLDDANVIVALRDALREIPPLESSTLDDLIDVLDRMGTAGNVAAKTAAGLLTDMRRLPLGRLFFGTPPAGLLNTDAVLTVITMGGLQLPDLSIDRKYWSLAEQLAVPMLHTANRLAVRRSYSGDQHRRKLVGLDEAHFMQGWASGRAFLVRLARDSRKWNLAALVASQNPKDILDLDVQNLVSTVFVGRIADDEDVAAEALRLLRVPTGVGYEATLASLSQQADTTSHARLGYREVVMRDVDGRVQKIRVDVSYVNGLLEALDTTPGGIK